MRCPKCGQRPFGFWEWVGEVRSPFRRVCNNCGARLRAGGLGYLWTLLHLPIAASIWWVWRTLRDGGYLESGLGVGGFVLLTAAVIFATAFVIPYFAFNSVYRVEGADSGR
jgi:hypothetical protein